MAHVTYQGVKVSELNIENKGYLADALKGFWARKWEDFARLTVIRGHGLISSPIAEKATVVKLKLPDHQPFYLNILNSSGSRTVLVKDDIAIVVSPGEQLQAVFTTEV
jgi:hypothetical protein